jgi:acyl carrier protein
MGSLEDELKRLIIETFELEGLTTDGIDSSAPLFGAGLGLDSIDALELGLALKKQYRIAIDTDSGDLIRHFSSVRNLARFVASQQQGQTA